MQINPLGRNWGSLVNWDGLGMLSTHHDGLIDNANNDQANCTQA